MTTTMTPLTFKTNQNYNARRRSSVVNSSRRSSLALSEVIMSSSSSSDEATKIFERDVEPVSPATFAGLTTTPLCVPTDVAEASDQFALPSPSSIPATPTSASSWSSSLPWSPISNRLSVLEARRAIPPFVLLRPLSSRKASADSTSTTATSWNLQPPESEFEQLGCSKSGLEERLDLLQLPSLTSS